MPSEKRDINVIAHIKDYCDEIEHTLDSISSSKEEYNASSIHRNAIALCVLQIGELVGLLSDGFKANNVDIPWRDIKQMRNIVAHKYGSFDFDVLWEVAIEDIPTLKGFCGKTLE